MYENDVKNFKRSFICGWWTVFWKTTGNEGWSYRARVNKTLRSDRRKTASEAHFKYPNLSRDTIILNYSNDLSRNCWLTRTKPFAWLSSSNVLFDFNKDGNEFFSKIVINDKTERRYIVILLKIKDNRCDRNIWRSP